MEDLVDNAIEAGASHIVVFIGQREATNEFDAGNIDLIRVIDDGHGMDSTTIGIALDIGSDVQYRPNSLSKYGMGLKSAGFSLGRRIAVIGRVQGQTTDCCVLDRDEIRSRDVYGIIREPATAPQLALFISEDSGCVLEISELRQPLSQREHWGSTLGTVSA